MRRAGVPPLLRPSTRLYAGLLGLLPRWLRTARAQEMVQLFEDLYRDAHARRGPLGILQLWSRSLRGLFANAVGRSGPGHHLPRSRRGDSLSRQLLHELRGALRSLRHDPGFTLVTILTLALGIGATTAIFSLVYGVAIRPLPYPESGRLVYIDHGAPGLGFERGLGMSPGLYERYQGTARTLEAIGYWRSIEVTLTGNGEPERVAAGSATSGLFRALGVQPQLGRLFLEQDDAPGSARVAMLSDALWVRRYGADPAIVGQAIEISGDSMLVVGVLPRAFAFREREIWVDNEWDFSAMFGGFSGYSVARMAPGAGIEDVERELNAQIAAFDTVYPGQDVSRLLQEGEVRALPVSLAEQIIGGVEETLWILLGSVAFVLLTACANVANLFLVRSETRQRETALRMALGASRGRLASMFVGESMVVSLVGGAAGVLVASVGVRLLVQAAPMGVPRLGEVRIDAVVLAVTTGITVAAGLLLGAVPALRRVGSLVGALHDGGRSATTGHGRALARQVLVVSQVALALMLLAGAGLMARSFMRLRTVDPGFAADNLLSFELSLPGSGYREIADAVAFHAGLLERLRALPGVARVGAAREAAFAGLSNGELMQVEGSPYPEGELPPVIWANRATEGYAEALGMRLLAGRTLRRSDLEERSNAVVINETAARTFFGDQSPVGRRVTFSVGADRDEIDWMTVVGVVGDVKADSLQETPQPMLFVSMRGADRDMARQMSYVIRTEVPPLSLAAAVRRTVWDLDPNLPLVRLRSMREAVNEASAPMAFTMTLLGIAAAVSLLLGCVGVYGVVAYVVRHRTAEIGVRMALGARQVDVRRMVLRQGVLLALIGIGLGAIGTSLLVHTMASMLYGIDPFDPATHLAAAGFLVGLILLATWAPAQRAARIDPGVALKRGEG